MMPRYQIPQEIIMTAPPVHVIANNEIIWRLAGAKDGSYAIKVTSGGEKTEKTVCIGSDLPRISAVRLRVHLGANAHVG